VMCNRFAVKTGLAFTPKGLHITAGGRVLAHPRRDYLAVSPLPVLGVKALENYP
jgi:hypothetical protein